MPKGDEEPLVSRPAWMDPDGADELAESSPVPGDDDYFESGSFAQVPMQLGDEPDEPSAEEPEEVPPRRPEIDDSPRVIAQLGEDPGVVSREDPDDA
jgi:hypothetical protein